jgi:hypothetical protein
LGVLSLASGQSGPPVSAVTVLVVVGCLVLAWVAMIALGFQKYRGRRPAREAARARPVTFAMPVKLRPTRTVGRFHGPGSDLVNLTVRGDLVEVASPHRLFQVIAQQEFYLDAGGVTFCVERAYRGRERISITGTSDGRHVVLSVSTAFGLRPIWDALTAAGAEPTGDPPQDPRASLAR